MKRFTLLLFFLLLTVIAFSQNIAGTWIETINTETVKGFGTTCTKSLNLFIDGTLIREYYTEIKVPTADKNEFIRVRCSCSGTWEYNGDMLTQTFDQRSSKSEVLEFPESLPDEVKNYAANAMFSLIKDQAKKPVKSDVLELTSDTLKIIETGFDNAVIETYIRRKD